MKRICTAIVVVVAVAGFGPRCAAQNTTTVLGPGGFPPLPPGKPQPPPLYMVDNVGNSHGVAPDKGLLDGPILEPLNASLEALIHPPLDRRQTGSFWYGTISHSASKSPFAAKGYQVFRNVKNFGAKGDGVTDGNIRSQFINAFTDPSQDTAAINNAIVSGSRCGGHCGSTSTLYATIYFPPGTYLVSSPIVQYYFTTFVGDYNTRPVIKGSTNFTGIALIDNDVYYPGGNGAEWYINQNQFYRGVRNFVIDMTGMASNNTQNGQNYVSTGIHWQVAQATHLVYIDIKMPTSGPTQQTAVGIFMENGSGGFMSDITFEGGNIGFRAGSQQFTARGLQFTSCLTAISSIWDWGFTWQDITITSTYIAIDATSYGGPVLDTGHSQGTGSIAVVDSTFNAVPYGITTHAGGPSPNIVLDNVQVTNPYGTPASIIQEAGGAPFLTCPANGEVTIQSWAMGIRYTSLYDTPTNTSGNIVPAPSKAASLLSNGKYFTRSRPQYQTSSASNFIIVTDHGVANDGTGDQTSAINSVLAGAGSSIVFFPAGVYMVKGTVTVPLGTKIVGEVWSQIMGSGSYFQDQKNPKVMVQVGKPGDSGVVEISEMLFTVSGPTAGCILMEWNVKQTTQGSAAMWDSHFRVGGATGSNLGLAECPVGNVNSKCMGATMLLHLTKGSSGYFENVWAWVADHDLDSPLNADDGDDEAGVPLASNVQIAVYSARGVLIESQGPTWFYGTASEHSVLYQYELLGAQNIYLGTMQTETPYFQPDPTAFSPFTIGTMQGDPTFDTCVVNSSCVDAWAFRILNTTNVYVYSAGFYSFFQDFDTYCNPLEDCQEKLVDTSFSQGLWLFNIFTKGAVQIISPQGLPPVFQNDSNQLEYTSEISAWLPLSDTGGNIGGESGDGQTIGTVSILPLPCTTVHALSTFTMSAACTSGIIVLPTSGPSASSQNTPSGEPPICNEICDFYRMLSGTCCGTGGYLGNPIVIAPNVTIPWDIILPSGYIPNVNITVPVQGGYTASNYYSTTSTSSDTGGVTASTTSGTDGQSSQSTPLGGSTTPGTNTSPSGGHTSTVPPGTSPTSGGGGGGTPTSHPCGYIPDGIPTTVLGISVPLPTAITLPAGLFCDPRPTPIIIPPAPLPDDPPCSPPATCAPCQAGECPPSVNNPPDDDSDPCNDPDPSPETGKCSNGNFPVWDQATGQIMCDIPDAQVPAYISECQQIADENYNETENAIECHIQACNGGTGTFRKRANPKDPTKDCAVPPFFEYGPPTDSPQLQCDFTFQCDTDEWPNVCNNARSAIQEKGQPQVLTYHGKDVHLTDRWLDLHGLVSTLDNRLEGGDTDDRRDRGTLKAVGGWGLIGCQVEEYPFGNSWPRDPGSIAAYNDRPTLRLIPQQENGDHGRALRNALDYARYVEQKISLTYCVSVTGNTQPADYCINDSKECKNKCAAAYGPAFILVNDAQRRDQRAAERAGLQNEQRWDKWFDAAPGRKYDHTISLTTINGVTAPVTTAIPPRFAPTTAPGNFAYPNGWPLIAPGQKIYTGIFPNGAWVNSYIVPPGHLNAGATVTVGIPRAAPRIPPNDGTNLIWDSPPANAFPSKRSIDEVHDESFVLSKNASVPISELIGPSLDTVKKLSRRQAVGGSWLDPAIYSDVLGCPVGSPDEFGGNEYATFSSGAGTIASTSASSPLTTTTTATTSTSSVTSSTSGTPTPGPGCTAGVVGPNHIIVYSDSNCVECLGVYSEDELFDHCAALSGTGHSYIVTSPGLLNCPVCTDPANTDSQCLYDTFGLGQGCDSSSGIKSLLDCGASSGKDTSAQCHQIGFDASSVYAFRECTGNDCSGTPTYNPLSATAYVTPPAGTGTLCIAVNQDHNGGTSTNPFGTNIFNFVAFPSSANQCDHTSEGVFVGNPQEEVDPATPCNVTPWGFDNEICGTSFTIVNSGPLEYAYFESGQADQQCGYALQVNGFTYYGSADNADACSYSCDEGTALTTGNGRFRFDNVPIC